MIQEEALIRTDITSYLERHQQKELLRLVAVGSVDDGKSTLIGRLLHDTQAVFEDQLSAVRKASKQGAGEIDFSLFTDGLKAEREQGITIDVAYRYFSTERRKFIIADTPGHVQYTRNMATGASTANVAVILIDARLGVLTQSRRHAYIASLLGIPHLVVGINKMDLVGFARDTYERIREEFERFTARLGFRDVTFIPLSALAGDNVVTLSDRTPWYDGEPLLEFLETVPIANDRNEKSFRYPIQYVNRPHLDYRGFAGQIASGRVSVGDAVVALPSRQASRVVAIDGPDGELSEAHTPMSVAIRLADEIDLSRGDMLVRPDDVPAMTRRLDATVVWMSETPLDTTRSYLVKHTSRSTRVDVERLTYAVDLETLKEVETDRLAVNDIGRVVLRCHQPLFVDPYRENRATGAFILIDALTNNTVAAGMIEVALDRPVDEAPAEGSTERARPTASARVSAVERHLRLGQRGLVVWLRGSDADQTRDAAFALERTLFDAGRVVRVLDGADDETKDASATLARSARELAAAGLVVLVAESVVSHRDHTNALAESTTDDTSELDVDARTASTLEAATALVLRRSSVD